MPVNSGEFVWRPVRRRFGISAFGSNAYSAEKAGQRVIEEHFERDGHEEMYVVLRGRATFTLGDDELDAGPGTLVFVRPGTRRGAIAAEDDTFVLAVGAKPGVVFEPSLWEDVFAAYSYAEQGKLDRGARARAGGDLTLARRVAGLLQLGVHRGALRRRRQSDRAAEALGRARRRGDEEGRRGRQRLRLDPRPPGLPGVSERRGRAAPLLGQPTSAPRQARSGSSPARP